MTVATFAVPFAGAPGTAGQGDRLQLVITPSGSSLAPVTMTITAPETTHPTQAASFSSLPRPGLVPFYYWTGPQLETAELNFVLDGQGASIEPLIASLANLANTEVTVNNYGNMMIGTWWMSTVEFDPQRRETGTNNVTRTAAKITFTQSSDDAGVVGPTTVLTSP